MTMTQSFCPIYNEAREARPWEKTGNGLNAGLLFEKFADAWAWKSDSNGIANPPVPLFDAGSRGKKGKGGDHQDQKQGEWIGRLPKMLRPDGRQLEEACQRQQEMITALGGQIVCLINTSRFVTGMGREHPLENGFAFHHTLGAPFLPGSSLKGVLRAWLRETEGRWDAAKKVWIESKRTRDWFGTQGTVGRFLLLDMLPTRPPLLTVDIMTPHYGPYYQNAEIPGDWYSPVPISFLTVEENNQWQLGILPVPGQDPLGNEEIGQLIKALVEALIWHGAGAKTAVGYGRFERDAKAEERALRLIQECRHAEEEKCERQEELAKLPPELAALQQRADDENWQQDNSALLSGLKGYLKEHPTPSCECIDWIRDLLEQRYPGIWANPDKTRGKKNKPRYKERPRNIVYELKKVVEKASNAL